MLKPVAILVACLCLGAASPANADEINLVFGTTLSPAVHASVRIFHPWADRINEEGKGIVHIDVRDGAAIANLSNFYSRVEDDVIQISWGLQSAVGGKFPRSLVGALPFEVEKSEIGSVALWRVFKSGLLNAEYDTVQPLYLITFPPSGIHYVKAPKTLENLNGLKLCTGSKVGADTIERLGGTPISCLTSDYYTAMQRGMVDATMVQWTAFQPFKLQDVTFYHLETKLGGAPGMVFMDKKKYEALPAAARKILDDNSGEAESRVFGKFWDDVDDEGREMVKALGPKQQIISQSPEIEAKWRAAVSPVINDWVKATPDGDKVLAAFRSETAALKGSK